MPLVQRAVRAMPVLVQIIACWENAAPKPHRPVKGRVVGHKALFAAVPPVRKYATVEKNAVQTAVCPLMPGILVVGRNIALREHFVALDRLGAVPMNGNAVEIPVGEFFC